MAQNVPLSSSPCSLILMHHFFFFFFFDATIGFKGPLPAQLLPSALTHLVVNNSFNIPLDDLPLSVTHLTLGGRFNQKIDHLPSSLKYPQSLLLISQPLFLREHNISLTRLHISLLDMTLTKKLITSQTLSHISFLDEASIKKYTYPSYPTPASYSFLSASPSHFSFLLSYL